MTSRILPLVAAALVLGLLTSRGPGVLAQQTHDHAAPAAQGQPQPQTQTQTHEPAAGAPAQGDAARMKMHAQMMAGMQAQDARLDSLLETMNGASGPAKVEAIASVVRELVQAQKAMHQRMAEMHAHHAATAGNGAAH